MPAKKPMTVNSAAKIANKQSLGKKMVQVTSATNPSGTHRHTENTNTRHTMHAKIPVGSRTDSLRITAYTALAQRHIVKIIFRSLIANT